MSKLWRRPPFFRPKWPLRTTLVSVSSILILLKQAEHEKHLSSQHGFLKIASLLLLTISTSEEQQAGQESNSQSAPDPLSQDEPLVANQRKQQQHIDGHADQQRAYRRYLDADYRYSSLAAPVLDFELGHDLASQRRDKPSAALQGRKHDKLQRSELTDDHDSPAVDQESKHSQLQLEAQSWPGWLKKRGGCPGDAVRLPVRNESTDQRWQ